MRETSRLFFPGGGARDSLEVWRIHRPWPGVRMHIDWVTYKRVKNIFVSVRYFAAMRQIGRFTVEDHRDMSEHISVNASERLHAHAPTSESPTMHSEVDRDFPRPDAN